MPPITSEGSANRKDFMAGLSFLAVIALIVWSGLPDTPSMPLDTEAPRRIDVSPVASVEHVPSEAFTGEVRTVDTVDDPSALGYSGQHKLVVDPSGTLYIAYRKPYKRKQEIFVAKINAETVSGTDTPIAAIGASGHQRVPSIAIDSQGTLHVVWYGPDRDMAPDERHIKYASSRDAGATWTPWKNIAVVSGYREDEYWQEHPTLSVGRDDTLLVAWEGKDAQHAKQQIKFTRSLDGGSTWSTWTNISPTPKWTQSRPAIAETPDGKLFLFMYSSFGAPAQRIHYSVSENGGDSWGEWQTLPAPFGDMRHLSAATGPQGTLRLVWRMLADHSPAQIYSASYHDGTWGEALPIAPSERHQFFPSLGPLSSQETVVSWFETEDDSGLPRERPLSGDIVMASIAPSGKLVRRTRLPSGIYPVLSSTARVPGLPFAFLSSTPEADTFHIQTGILP